MDWFGKYKPKTKAKASAIYRTCVLEEYKSQAQYIAHPLWRSTNDKCDISQVRLVKLKKKHKLVASIFLFCIAGSEERKGDISI